MEKKQYVQQNLVCSFTDFKKKIPNMINELVNLTSRIIQI
jgi:hypothetical protein